MKWGEMRACGVRSVGGSVIECEKDQQAVHKHCPFDQHCALWRQQVVDQYFAF